MAKVSRNEGLRLFLKFLPPMCKSWYGKGIRITKEAITDLPDFDDRGKNIISKSLYALLLTMSRTLWEFNIPFFVDLDREIDGSILGCHFIIDKERLRKVKEDEDKYHRDTW